MMLAGCAGTAWVQQGKTEKQMHSDLAACERKAETTTLAESGTTRGDYGLATTGPNASLDPRGLNPRQLKDKSEMTSRFDDEVGRCMKGKGYADPKAPAKRR